MRDNPVFQLCAASLLIATILLIVHPVKLTFAQDPVVSLPTPTVGPAGGVVLDAVTVVKTIEPTQLSPGQEATVTITLHGEAFEECLGVPGAPVDAILIIDNSVSARAWGRLDKAKAVAQDFMDQVSYPVYLQWDQPPLASRVGIVTSNYTEQGPRTELVELSQDFSTARTKVETVGADADTGLDEGLRIAREELVGKERRQAGSMVLLVLHDNVPFTPEADKAAQELYQAGVSIYVIGVGKREDLDEEEVAKLTRNADHFLFEPQPADLFHLFVQATGGATDLAAKDYRISDDFHPPGLVELVPGSIDARGADVKSEVEDGKPVWQIPHIKKGETIALSYRVRVPLTGVGGQVQLISSNGWLCCNGCFHNWATIPDENRTIDTLLPTATPRATNAPVSSPTPAATGALAPSPTSLAMEVSEADPTPTPTPTPDGIGIPIISSLARKLLPFISIPWREILLILLIPLLLWLLWQLFKLLQRTPPVAEEVSPLQHPESPKLSSARIQEPVLEPQPMGATIPGLEDDDNEALLRELLEERCWKGYILTTELGLREPWPMEIRMATQSTEIDVLELRNKGETFYWQKKDGSGAEVPIRILEKAFAQTAKPRCPVVLIGHGQSADNLEIAVDILSNTLKKQTEVAVRAVYREPDEGQEPRPLRYGMHIQAVENPIGPVVQVPILEQNL